MDFNDDISNDNSPSQTCEYGHSQQDTYTSLLGDGDALGRHRLAQDRAFSYTSSFGSGSGTASTWRANRNVSKAVAGTSFNSSIVFFLSFSFWVLTLVISFMAVQEFTQPIAHIAIFVISGWSALFLAYVSKCQNREFFRDLGLSSALAALAGSLFIAITNYNMPLNMPLICGGMAFITVFLAILLKEQYYLTVSNMATLSWTATSLMSFENSEMHWIFPILWIMQMALAIQLRAKISIVLATISGILWVCVSTYLLTMTEQISGLMALSIMFSLGITYSRIGKSMQDKHILSGLFQTNVGWAIAAICALFLQDYWLMETPHFPWTIQANTPLLDYPMMMQWSAILLMCTAIIAACSFARYLAERQTVWGGIGIIGFSVLLPASILLQPQFILAMDELGIAATPSFGLLIGGAITGLSLAMLANGLRRSKPLMMLLALITLSAEAVIVIDSLYTNPDNLMLFGFSVLLIALTAGLYAHNSQTLFTKQSAHA